MGYRQGARRETPADMGRVVADDNEQDDAVDLLLPDLDDPAQIPADKGNARAAKESSK